MALEGAMTRSRGGDILCLPHPVDISSVMLGFETYDVCAKFRVENRFCVHRIVYDEFIPVLSVLLIQIRAHSIHSQLKAFDKLAIFLVGNQFVGGYPDGHEAAYFEGFVQKVSVSLMKMIKRSTSPYILVFFHRFGGHQGTVCK